MEKRKEKITREELGELSNVFGTMIGYILGVPALICLLYFLFNF